jgi:hypothetical protein
MCANKSCSHHGSRTSAQRLLPFPYSSCHNISRHSQQDGRSREATCIIGFRFSIDSTRFSKSSARHISSMKHLKLSTLHVPCSSLALETHRSNRRMATVSSSGGSRKRETESWLSRYWTFQECCCRIVVIVVFTPAAHI